MKKQSHPQEFEEVQDQVVFAAPPWLAIEKTQLNDMTLEHLSKMLLWQTDGSPIRKLIGHGVPLPLTLSIRLPQGKTKVRVFEGDETDNPVATICLRRWLELPPGGDEIDLRVLIDVFGKFWATAVELPSGNALEALCETHRLVSAYEGHGSLCETEAAAADSLANKEFYRVRVHFPSSIGHEAGALWEEPEPSTSGVVLGLVEHDTYHLKIAPGTPLPASCTLVLATTEDDQEAIMFELLAVHLRDLYQDEQHDLDLNGCFKLIDDDLDNLLTFFIEDLEPRPAGAWVFNVTVTIDREGKLSLSAFDNGTGTAKEVAFDGSGDALDLSHRIQTEWDRSSRLSASDEGDEDGDCAAEDDQASENEEDRTQKSDRRPDPITAARLNDGERTSDDLPILDPEATVADGDRRKIGDNGGVFISHRSETDGAFATWLVVMLEQEGLPCWIASRDIKVGTNWNRSIMEAVQQCSVMIVVISEGCFESEFVQAEVQRALKLRKRVVPLLLQPSLPYADIDARLETKQAVDWYRGVEYGLALLRGTLR